MTGPDTTAQGKDRMVTAIRIKPKGEPKEPVEIREIIVESTPPVAKFTAPVEYIIDVDRCPRNGRLGRVRRQGM